VADGGVNMALLCAAQKLLCADAVTLAHPKNASEALIWKTSSHCSCEGVMGQDSALYNRAESTKIPYMRVLMRVETSLVRQSFVARCTAAPAAASCQLISWLKPIFWFYAKN
jgi:hypothetical protein